MPPDGTPPSEAQVLCRCFQCYAHTSVDQSSATLVNGKYVDGKTLEVHRQLQESLNATPKIASDQVSSQFLNPERYPTTDPASIPVEVATSHVDEIGTLLQEKRLITSSPHPLKFKYPPSPLSTRPVGSDPQPSLSSRVYNPGPYELSTDGHFTSQLLLYERWLLQSMKTLEWYGKSNRPAHFRYKRTIVWNNLLSAFGDLDAYKITEWERQENEAKSEWEKGRHLRRIGQPLSDMEPAAAVSILLVAVLHLLCGISIDRCSFVLVTIRSVLELTTTFCTPSDRVLNPKVISSTVPTDVRTVINSLNLRPRKRSYVSCPKCFECYPVDEFPDRCTRMETPASQPCGHALTKEGPQKGKKSKVPKRLFEYHDIHNSCSPINIFLPVSNRGYISNCPWLFSHLQMCFCPR